MSRASRTARRALPLTAASLLVGSGLSALALGQGSAQAATPTADAGRSGAAVEVTDDFNGDGYADLVVGAPGGTVSGKAKAGYVVVTYGSADGLDPAKKKTVSRSTSGVPGAATAKQEFGRHVTKADLDQDGYADLVIGTGVVAGGSVILWGSETGLTGGTGITAFGFSPQAADFDGDGVTDLALFDLVGSHGDDPVGQKARLWKGPIARTGTPAATLDFMDESQWSSYESDERPYPGCRERPEVCVDGPLSVKGPVIPKAVGDINGDGRADIAANDYAGDGQWGNSILYGSPTGFERGDAPGSRGALGVGDVNGDHYDDLVVGERDDEDQTKAMVAYGSAAGLKADVQKFDQDLPGIPGAEEEGDRFGSSVSVGDVTGDGYADIALGVVGEDVKTVGDAGAVVLVHGSANGVTGTGAQAFHQDTAGVPGVAEADDQFGAATALLDVTGDGHRDLAASSTRENAQAGAVWSLRGTATGLTATDSVAFGPKDVAAPDVAALFGSTLR